MESRKICGIARRAHNPKAAGGTSRSIAERACPAPLRESSLAFATVEHVIRPILVQYWTVLKLYQKGLQVDSFRCDPCKIIESLAPPACSNLCKFIHKKSEHIFLCPRMRVAGFPVSGSGILNCKFVKTFIYFN